MPAPAPRSEGSPSGAPDDAELGFEIERKYLLRALPDLPPGEVLDIEQGYLPGKRLQERLRRIVQANAATRYVRTVKLGRGVRRVEVEEATDEHVFQTMWPLTEGCRVRKRRYRVPVGDRVWEIDEFLDRRLFLAEIELEHEDEPIHMPAWLAPVVLREVTDDGSYTNRQLAR